MYFCKIYTLNLEALIALEAFSANKQNVAQPAAGLSLMLMFSRDTGLKSDTARKHRPSWYVVHVAAKSAESTDAL